MMTRWTMAVALAFGLAGPAVGQSADPDVRVISRVMTTLGCAEAVRLFQGGGATSDPDRLALISFLYGYAVANTEGTDMESTDAFMASFATIAATCEARPATLGLLNMLRVFEAD